MTAWTPERVDYVAVRRLRRAVVARLSAELAGGSLSDDSRRELGRKLIVEELTEWVDAQVRAGACALDPVEEEALARAVEAAIFGLGRLQPLLDDPEVDNVDLHGCDDVWVELADGRVQQAPPVADSDAELVETLQGFAAYLGQTRREFSTAQPFLNLRLPGGSRLHASIEVSPRPQVSVRRHRFADADLGELTNRGTIDPSLRAFLAAAVRARKSIVVTGAMGAGKTTLMRALAAEFPRFERIGTVEEEYELGLHLLPHRHRRVVALECRAPTADNPGSGIDLATLVREALRMNLRRLLVGEVRGAEIVAMLDAMVSGCPGSLCTLHAKRGHGAIDRMIELATRGGQSEANAQRLIAGGIDLIVHLDLVEDLVELDEQRVAGRRARYVDEVVEVAGLGESGRPALNTIYAPGVDGRAVPVGKPACLDDLLRAGLDHSVMDAPT